MFRSLFAARPALARVAAASMKQQQQPMRLSAMAARFSTAAAVNPVKYTTGLTGLDAVPNARVVLLDVYKRTIEKAKTYDDSEWNKMVINLTLARYDVVQQNESHEVIEKIIDAGQVEELILQAEQELELLDYLNESDERKPWTERDDETKADLAEATYAPFGEDEAKDAKLSEEGIAALTAYEEKVTTLRESYLERLAAVDAKVDALSTEVEAWRSTTSEDNKGKITSLLTLQSVRTATNEELAQSIAQYEIASEKGNLLTDGSESLDAQGQTLNKQAEDLVSERLAILGELEKELEGLEA